MVNVMTQTQSSRPMKKITYIFAATALMALAASCQVEPVQQEIVPEETIETVEQSDCIISFAATVGEQPAAPGTRATIDGDMPVWESGDKIALRAFSSDPSMATIPSGRVAGPSVTKLVSSELASGGSSSESHFSTHKDRIFSQMVALSCPPRNVYFYQ